MKQRQYKTTFIVPMIQIKKKKKERNNQLGRSHSRRLVSTWTRNPKPIHIRSRREMESPGGSQPRVFGSSRTFPIVPVLGGSAGI